MEQFTEGESTREEIKKAVENHFHCPYDGFSNSEYGETIFEN